VKNERTAADAKEESMTSGVSFFLHDGVVLESSGSEEEAAVAPI
jgi:hypothetical protein